MQPTDKFRTDLDRAIGRHRGEAPGAQVKAVREFFFRSFPAVAEEAKAALFTSFADRWRESPERATAWLSGVGSILFMDYDGTSFSREEWVDIRESLSVAQSELDLDLLSYALSLVVDHGAL